jgi:hypothetical protein
VFQRSTSRSVNFLGAWQPQHDFWRPPDVSIPCLRNRRFDASSGNVDSDNKSAVGLSSPSLRCCPGLIHIPCNQPDFTVIGIYPVAGCSLLTNDYQSSCGRVPLPDCGSFPVGLSLYLQRSTVRPTPPLLLPRAAPWRPTNAPRRRYRPCPLRSA